MNLLKMDDFENAERELEIFEKDILKMNRSYERALINQLYGQFFYAVQGDYDKCYTLVMKKHL